MTSHEAITKIVRAVAEGDLVEAEKVLEDYCRENWMGEKPPRYEEMKREFFSDRTGEQEDYLEARL